MLSCSSGVCFPFVLGEGGEESIDCRVVNLGRNSVSERLNQAKSYRLTSIPELIRRASLPERIELRISAAGGRAGDDMASSDGARGKRRRDARRREEGDVR